MRALKYNRIALEQLQRGQRALVSATEAISDEAPAAQVQELLNNALHAFTILGREVAAAVHNETKVKEQT